jgi:hypothetical protein
MPIAGTLSPLEGMIRFNMVFSLAAAANEDQELAPRRVDPASAAAD